MPADSSALKIVVCGPSLGGKTAICNYLCEENLSTPFKVMEYSTANINGKGSQSQEMTKKEGVDAANMNPFYTATEGVRIRELEKEVFGPGGRGGRYSLQLWDSSGDHSYEGTWPAIINDANGVILVYNPAKAAQEQEITIWYDSFVKGSGLSDDQCLVILQTATAKSNDKGGTEMDLNMNNMNSLQRYTPPSKLGRCHILNNSVNIGEAGNGNKAGIHLKKSFDEFVYSLVNNGASSSSASYAK